MTPAVLEGGRTKRPTAAGERMERPALPDAALGGLACGPAADGDAHLADRCRDIRPELIIELL
ncbi:MAG TPA: hypothetical protein VJ975_10370 [Candidatus Limnocylindria bacterium]|nr:hypothetical protein [Candidatus Limnocylindria bacterium]